MSHPRKNICPLDRSQNSSTDQWDWPEIWKTWPKEEKDKIDSRDFSESRENETSEIFNKAASKSKVIRIMLSVFIVFRTRSNSFRLQEGRFRLNVANCLRIERAVTRWNRLPWTIKEAFGKKKKVWKMAFRKTYY